MADNITFSRSLEVTLDEKTTELPDESQVISITNRRVVSGNIVNTDGLVELIIPSNPKYIELRNTGSAAINYHLSDPAAATGAIVAGGVIILVNSTTSKLEIDTASNQAVSYELITGE